MNAHERSAWRVLVDLGAREITLGGKPALDLRTIRVGSQKRLATLLHAFLNVAGRSGTVRRHVDRQGQPVFVVCDSLR